MKARTKSQKRVEQIQKYVKPLPDRVLKWAQESLFKHTAHRYKSGKTNCLSCGHSWQSDFDQPWKDEITQDHICPNCKRRVKIISTMRRTDSARTYFSVTQRLKEYQVVRTFLISGNWRVGEKPRFMFTEAYRVCTRKDGKQEVYGKLGGGFYGYQDSWTGWMEIRKYSHKYQTEGAMYPRLNLQPYVKRTGFNYDVYWKGNHTVSSCIGALLTRPYSETLLKCGAYKWFDYSIDNYALIEKYWATIKIMIRNDYDMPDPQSYFDMIRALEYFNKDIQNAKYVCPDNFDKAHDYWLAKKAKKQQELREKAEREELERMLKEEKKAVNGYARRMKKFAKLRFKAGDVEILPIMTVDKVAEAGKILHHCIFRSDHYWKEDRNLLFAAYIDGQLIETTQYILPKQTINHSLGLQNKPSRHHDLIIKTIKQATPSIMKIARSKKRKKKVKV